MSRVLLPAAWAAGLFLGACATPLPTYPWVDHGTALAIMSERAGHVRTVSGSGSVVLGDGDGSTVTLESALAARVPGWLRIRAWKFGHAAFDLTLTPEGLWLMTGEDAPSTAGSSLGELTSANFGRAWEVFTGDFFGGSPPGIEDPGGPTFTLTRPWGDDGVSISCVIDRATLTAQRYEVRDSDGRVRQSLELGRFREIGGIPWPFRVSARGESGELRLDMDEVELNTALPEGAFRPPARAVKRP